MVAVESSMHAGPHARPPRLGRAQWVVLVVVGIFEVSTAVYVAWVNPISGYDENSYLINAWRFRGHENLPFTDNRPPLRWDECPAGRDARRHCGVCDPVQRASVSAIGGDDAAEDRQG